jgi:hypothetical protein
VGHWTRGRGGMKALLSRERRRMTTSKWFESRV